MKGYEGYGGRVVGQGMIHLVSLGRFNDAKILQEAVISAGSTLFQDDFTQGDGNWRTTHGNFFEVFNDRYYVGKNNGNSGEHRTFTGDSEWEDFTIEARTKLVRGEGFGIYFRASNEPNINSYIFQYEPGYDTGRQGSFLFRRVINGNEQAPFAVVRRVNTVFAGPDSWWYEEERDIKIEVKGNTFTAYVDGVPVVSGAENNLKKGRIGLRIWGHSQMYADWIKVKGDSQGMTVISRWRSSFR